MAAYVGMVYESLTPAARGTNDRYRAIFPLVVHTGNAEWNAAGDLRDVADQFTTWRATSRVAATCDLTSGGPRVTIYGTIGLAYWHT